LALLDTVLVFRPASLTLHPKGAKLWPTIKSLNSASASEIWIEEGQPYGKEHWEKARQEIEKRNERAIGPSPGP
jgi:hypothetical protein